MPVSSEFASKETSTSSQFFSENGHAIGQSEAKEQPPGANPGPGERGGGHHASQCRESARKGSEAVRTRQQGGCSPGRWQEIRTAGAEIEKEVLVEELEDDDHSGHNRCRYFDNNHL